MITGNSVKPVAILVASALSMAVMTGCSSTGHKSGIDKSASKHSMDIKKREAELAKAKSKMERDRKDLMAREAKLEKNKMMKADSSHGGGHKNLAAAGDGLFPPNPKPGECYARVLIPAQYETSTEKVVKREAGSRIETIPAKFAVGEETVVVKEASTKLVVVPAQYGTVTEKVLVKPASSRLVEVPAKYNTVTERVLDKAAHTVWKRSSAALGGGSGNIETRIDQSTGEIMCLVEVPATYKTVTKTVLVSPATVKETPVPAEYKTVTRRVEKSPATTKTVEIPAEYRTVKIQKIATPAQTREIAIPAEYQTVTKRTKVTEEELRWREVLCDVNITSNVVSNIQNAAKKAGYYKGSVDGVLGPMTLRAVNSWAKDKGLPVGQNYIPIETINAMGVNI